MGSIYVHVPFCKQRCAYCDFCSQTDMTLEKEYFSAVQKHIKSLADSTFLVESIFFGGGTPSSVDAKYICQTLDTIRESFCVSPNAEITVECNPESVTKEKICAYKASGVNRISLGVQSANDKTLQKIMRLHSFEKAKEAVQTVVNCGIKNVNVDLLLGLPDEGEKDFFQSLFAVAKLPVTHVSMYALEVYPHTVLGKKKGYVYMDDDTVASVYYKAVEQLKKLGFLQYEVSNFAKVGCSCKHNEGYWKGTKYIGIGAGASGYTGKVRYTNLSDLKAYVEAIEREVHPFDYFDSLTKDDLMYEAVMLGLRRREGINLVEFEEKFGPITTEDIYGNNRWEWINDPWPWENNKEMMF